MVGAAESAPWTTSSATASRRLLEKLRGANPGGDVHLVGGPTTIETYRALGAIDEFGLVVVPIFAGEGMQLTPAIRTDERLELKSQRTLPRGAVELVYEVR